MAPLNLNNGIPSTSYSPAHPHRDNWLETLETISAKIDVVNILYQLSPIGNIRLYSDRYHLSWSQLPVISPIFPIGNVLIGLSSARAWLVDSNNNEDILQAISSATNQKEIFLTNTESGATHPVRNPYLADLYEEVQARSVEYTKKGVGVISTKVDAVCKARTAACIWSILIAVIQIILVGIFWSYNHDFPGFGFLFFWGSWGIWYLISRTLSFEQPRRTAPVDVQRRTRYVVHRGMQSRFLMILRIAASVSEPSTDGLPCLETLSAGIPYTSIINRHWKAGMAICSTFLTIAGMQMVRQDPLANFLLLVCGSASVFYEQLLVPVCQYSNCHERDYFREECMLHALLRVAVFTNSTDIQWAGGIVLPMYKDRFAKEASIVSSLLKDEELLPHQTSTGNWKVDDLPTVLEAARRCPPSESLNSEERKRFSARLRDFYLIFFQRERGNRVYLYILALLMWLNLVVRHRSFTYYLITISSIPERFYF